VDNDRGALCPENIFLTVFPEYVLRVFLIFCRTNHNYHLSPATMVSMDLPTAVKNYQFGERAKSELIVVSQLCQALTGFPDTQKSGGKKMLLLLMEQVRSEVIFAAKSTEEKDFERAVNSINNAISLMESDQPDMALEKLAAAISASTTPAQAAWQVLSDHGLL
jgi:hypothetical protein